MTAVRQIVRYARRLGQITESGAKVLNRSTRCASTQPQRKIIEDENGKKIFPSPYGEITPCQSFIHDYVWKDVERHANYTALVCAVTGREYTYSEARDAANYIARSLLSMGLRKGDVVALVAPNYPESILAFLGIVEADLIITTVNPYYTAEEISRQLKDSRAKAMITVAEIADVALEAAKDSLAPGAHIVVIEDGTGPIPQGTLPFKDLVARGKTLPPLKYTQRSIEDTAILPYSSGTTGLPKGVMLTHKNLVSNMEMLRVAGGEMVWRQPTDTFQEVVPLILPFFHIFGMNGIVLPHLSSGSKLITVPKFTPDLFINVLEKNKVTSLFLVPPILIFFNAHPLIKKRHLESMELAISGAAPLGEADVHQFYDKFKTDHTKLKFCQGYGLTETSPVCTFEKTGLKSGSVGKNVASCEVRLVDPLTNKDVCVSGQGGEIWIKGPHVMKGYYNNEQATKETVVDGWLKTGDIAYYDEEYDFFITDRLKELIKVKGFQVAPAELEALLRMHPDVDDAAVVGVPDERSGEVPKAFIMVKDDAKVTEEDIKNFVKGKVSEYKELQGGVTFVDYIPKTSTGKILRTKLKNEYK